MNCSTATSLYESAIRAMRIAAPELVQQVHIRPCELLYESGVNDAVILTWFNPLTESEVVLTIPQNWGEVELRDHDGDGDQLFVPDNVFYDAMQPKNGGGEFSVVLYAVIELRAYIRTQQQKYADGLRAKVTGE